MPSPTPPGIERADGVKRETPRTTVAHPTLIRLIARALQPLDDDRSIVASPASDPRQRVRFRVD